MTADIGVVQRISLTANVIFHQAVAVITVFIISLVLANDDVSSISTWHMVLAPTGIMLLMMEGLILFMKDNVFTLYLARNHKVYVHSILMWLSAILVTVGIAFKISTKHGSHFNTTHGALGLSAWIFIWCSIFLGVATSQSQRFKNVIRPVWFKLIHILIGITAFTLGAVCLGYGLKEYLQYLSHEKIILAAIVTVGLLYGWALLDAFKSLFNQIRNVVSK